MPCRCDDYAETTDSLMKQVNELTKWLCWSMKTLERLDGGIINHDGAGSQFIMSPPTELRQWWKKHKLADEHREREEERQRNEKALKLKALSKLTLDEKRVLGLK